MIRNTKYVIYGMYLMKQGVASNLRLTLNDCVETFMRNDSDRLNFAKNPVP